MTKLKDLINEGPSPIARSAKDEFLSKYRDYLQALESTNSALQSIVSIVKNEHADLMAAANQAKAFGGKKNKTYKRSEADIKHIIKSMDILRKQLKDFTNKGMPSI